MRLLHNIGLITVNGDANTTAVTVKQTEAVAAAGSVPATAAVTEVASVQFDDIAIGEKVVLDGLTFTATKALTAAEVAAAFANITTGATHGGAKADNGIYTGKFTGKFTSGSVSADNKVVFTATEAKAITDLDSTGTTPGKATVTVTTKGVDAVTPVGAIANGVVKINDNSTANNTIKTVTVDGYATASTIASNALTDLTLKNSAAGATTMTLTSTVASLNVTLDDINGTVDLDGSAAIAATTLKTLNLTTTGEASDITLAAAGLETLTIAAAADLDLKTSFSASTTLKTVTITGTGNVDLGDISATATSLTSTTTGDVSATVNGTKATVTTGAGDDTIIVNGATTSTVTKAISLGAGDDKLTLSGIASVNVDTAAISGGEGTDTIGLTAANAVTFSSLANSTIFKSKVTGFEQLEITEAGTDNSSDDTVTINLENLGFNYVITNGTVIDVNDNDELILDKIANNGTVVLNATGLVTVNVKDANAAGSTADVLNVIANVANDVDAGTLTVANVETINITATDTTPVNTTTGAATIHESTLDLNAVNAKTVTITGNADLDLDMTGNTDVTSIDASKLTGNLKVTSYNTTTSATINGGLGNDDITANTLDKVFGGAGNDTLYAGFNGATLTGGAGNDLFVVGATDANGNSQANTYSKIMDFQAGDKIQLVYFDTDTDGLGADAAAPVAIDKITKLAASLDEKTASFSNFVDTAFTEMTSVGDAVWFMYGGDSYIVVDNNVSSDTYVAQTKFNDGEDLVIRIENVDLTGMSFNSTYGTIEIA